MNRLYAEMRAEVTGNKLAGHAAVFGQETLVKDFYEVIQPGFFDRALREQEELAKIGRDTIMQANHDGLPLARTGSGTLRLAADSEGLAFEADLPDTTLGRDIRELVARGDLRSMSFGFTASQDEWSKREGGAQLRTLIEADRLFDISPVNFPAYAGAAVALRNLNRSPASARAQAALIRAKLREANA